ncbi:hypothetical protein D3C80_1282100 [compost metagenome]
MTRQIVAAHQGVVSDHVAEQVVELVEDEPPSALALLLVPGVGGLVPGDVGDGGDVEAGTLLFVLDDADEAIGALAHAQQPLEDGVAGGAEIAIEQKALVGGHHYVEQLALLLDALLRQHFGGDVVGQLDHPEQGPRLVGDGHVGGVDPDTAAPAHDAAKRPRADLATEHPLPEAIVLLLLLGGKQQQVGLAYQLLGGIADEVAEQSIDRHHAAIEIELGYAIGSVQGGQPGKGVITPQGAHVDEAVYRGIHGQDSFRSPTPAHSQYRQGERQPQIIGVRRPFREYGSPPR